MSETIIVAGRRVKIDGTEGYFYIANADFDDARYVQKDGKWHSTTGFDRGHWPTEAAAREFASSLAARSQPAEVAEPITPLDSDALVGIVARSLAELVRSQNPSIRNWYDLAHSDLACDLIPYLEKHGAKYFSTPLPAPPVPQEPDRT